MAESSGILRSNFCKGILGASTKYGAFSNASCTKARETFDYTVCPGDTLIGLAVRHNVSVDEMKRLNNLWTDSDLALRVKLRIPIVRRIPTHETSAHVVETRSSSFTTPSLDCGVKKKHSHPFLSMEDRSELSASDFLTCFDKQLVELKNSVEKLESKSLLVEYDNLSSTFLSTAQMTLQRRQ